MKIKNDGTIVDLARELSLTPNAVYGMLSVAFRINGFILEEDEYGETIEYNFKQAGESVVDAFKGIFGKNKYSIDAVILFAKIILIGDGDCPECGGDCKKEIPEGSRLMSFDWDSEPEWTLPEVNKCTVCNYELE